MKLFILIIIIYVLYRFMKGWSGSGQSHRKNEESENGGAIDEMVQDPFCKTYVPMMDAKKKIINGKKYFFCSEECAKKFEDEITGV